MENKKTIYFLAYLEKDGKWGEPEKHEAYPSEILDKLKSENKIWKLTITKE
tara:strand:- start:106 stop:258 length:153 start_codon:yes stop_codon:yes gene_type:complete